jgi:Arc/MetJ-type ribon-helix-helix transcriptional regulator
MSRSGKISVALPPQQLSQLRRIVDAGEFATTSDVVREAVRTFLNRRLLHAGRLGATRFSHAFDAHNEPLAEPVERVDLLFDAGDAKA